jgi:hypothetical protein
MTSPTTQILAAATEILTARDGSGRVLTVRRLGALDRLRLFKAIGAELSDNAAYLGMAMLAISVTDIDGVPVPAPATEAQLEALVHRLGDIGMDAIAACLTGSAANDEARIDPGN